MSHARQGVYARWFCKKCTTAQHPGRYPCTDCCGYTTDPEKVTRGIKTVWGKPMAGCLQ